VPFTPAYGVAAAAALSANEATLIIAVEDVVPITFNAVSVPLVTKAGGRVAVALGESSVVVLFTLVAACVTFTNPNVVVTLSATTIVVFAAAVSTATAPVPAAVAPSIKVTVLSTVEGGSMVVCVTVAPSMNCVIVVS
jgi:hypothetical protein